MGQVGRYIDSRPDEGKDRVIEAREWAIDAWVRSVDCKCLVGYAEDMTRSEMSISTEGWDAGIRAATLFNRFGVSRMSRLFKLRAAKDNVVSIPTEITASN